MTLLLYRICKKIFNTSSVEKYKYYTFFSPIFFLLITLKSSLTPYFAFHIWDRISHCLGSPEKNCVCQEKYFIYKYSIAFLFSTCTPVCIIIEIKIVKINKWNIWSYWGFLKKVCSYISHILDLSYASKSNEYEKKEQNFCSTASPK